MIIIAGYNHKIKKYGEAKGHLMSFELANISWLSNISSSYNKSMEFVPVPLLKKKAWGTNLHLICGKCHYIYDMWDGKGSGGKG